MVLVVKLVVARLHHVDVGRIGGGPLSFPHKEHLCTHVVEHLVAVGSGEDLPQLVLQVAGIVGILCSKLLVVITGVNHVIVLAVELTAVAYAVELTVGGAEGIGVLLHRLERSWGAIVGQQVFVNLEQSSQVIAVGLGSRHGV